MWEHTLRTHRLLSEATCPSVRTQMLTPEPVLQQRIPEKPPNHLVWATALVTTPYSILLPQVPRQRTTPVPGLQLESPNLDHYLEPFDELSFIMKPEKTSVYTGSLHLTPSSVVTIQKDYAHD